ncbi:MAG: hypothetical protein P1U50_01095 [Parvibaculaceae bacterium]|nr:hypothetical protein [Parvibaculaceae bacterium]
MAVTTTAGGATSDAYIDADELSTYVTSVGLSLTGDTDAQEANIRRATQYLDREYTWRGYRTNETQALKWPRVISDGDEDGYSIDSDTIPQAIKDACAEIAYLYNSGVDLLAVDTSGPVKRSKVKAGPVESETEYLSSKRIAPRVLIIDGLVEQYSLSGPRAATSFVRWLRG